MSTFLPKPFHVLIVAAGTGSRMGGGLPKQYLPLGGKPLLRHSVETFLRVPGLKSLRVVIRAEDETLYRQAVSGFPLASFVIGGPTRQESVSAGAHAIQEDDPESVVLVHDAARPFIDTDHILKLLEQMTSCNAATLALPITETIRKEQKNQNIAGDLIERSGLWALQTPQASKLHLLKKACSEAMHNGFTDDTMMLSAIGEDVHLVLGSRKNMKLTTQEDFLMAQDRFKIPDIRTGNGFDVHAFGDESENIRLCGIDVPHTHGLAGHSDADVGLHALTDAILGAIGENDIGFHFPPTDSAFKNMDSAEFLKKAVRLARETGAQILNADVTLICESPKIRPYADQMKAKISEILEIAPERVNVKATTTEGLGFTGRREGIACQSVVSVAFPS